MSNATPILLVEDDSIDAMTVRRAFKDIGSARPITHVLDGEQALDYLRDEAHDQPGLILLDLNMPRMNGLEFLEHKQADRRMCDIPVVVLTTSTNASDIERSYDLGAKDYIVKSIDYSQFVESVTNLDTSEPASQ
jgi:CheY-like chemotaxis protein